MYACVDLKGVGSDGVDGPPQALDGSDVAGGAGAMDTLAKLRPRRAPRAVAAFRLATIYLPQFLLFKWVVVKYSWGPLPVADRVLI
jgi:hypothetical protein